MALRPLRVGITQRYSHEPHDNVVGEGAQRKRLQFLALVNRYDQHLGGTARDFSSIHTLNIEGSTEVTADGGSAKAHSVRTGTDSTECLAVDVIFLFYRAPVVRIAKDERVGSTVGVECRDNGCCFLIRLANIRSWL